jgi:hypothetical protein
MGGGMGCLQVAVNQLKLIRIFVDWIDISLQFLEVRVELVI